MTDYTQKWRISYPEGPDDVAVHTDVEATARTTDQAITDAGVILGEQVAVDVDAAVAEATRNVVYQQTSQAAWLRDEDEIAYTVVFEEGRRSWIESDPRGYPTSWAKKILCEVLEDCLGGGGGGGSGASYAAGGDGELLVIRSPNPYPQARDILDEPFLLLEDQGVGESIGYPQLFYDISGDLWVCWSTDHAPQWTQSGVWAAKFNDGPLNGIDKSTIQKIFLSSKNTGAQCETPIISKHRYSIEGVYLMLYSKGSGRGKQSTYLASAPDVTGPWQDLGIVQQMESQLQPGNGHTGYLYPQRIGGRWQSTSRYGGTSLGRQGYWYGSEDWRTWRPDPRLQSDFIDVLETFDWFNPEADQGSGHRFTAAWPFWFNGGFWKFGAVSDSNYQDPDFGDQVAHFTAPLADDLRRVRGLPIDLGLNAPLGGCGYITWQDRAFGVDRIGGPRTPGTTALTIREIY